MELGDISCIIWSGSFMLDQESVMCTLIKKNQKLLLNQACPNRFGTLEEWVQLGSQLWYSFYFANETGVDGTNSYSHNNKELG